MLWAVDNQTVARAIALQGHKAVNRYRWENIKEQLYETYGIHS